jgi:fructoselysine-6-P-deglycase FrlB-like protein
MRQGLDEVVPGFDARSAAALHSSLSRTKRGDIVGIGSSDFFPAGNAAYIANMNDITAGYKISAMQDEEAIDARHHRATIVCISNSGTTGEVVEPAQVFKQSHHPDLFGITTFPNSPLARVCGDKTIILPCDKEAAVAATKTVLAQALTLHAAVRGPDELPPDVMRELAQHLQKVFETDIDPQLVEQMSSAPAVRLVTPKNGFGNEARLKLTETTGMQVHNYYGTEAMHGPQQAFAGAAQGIPDVVLIFDPARKRESAMRRAFEDTVGANVWAVAGRDTVFRTIRLPEFERREFRGYTQLVFAWALMLKVAEHKGLTPEQLDHPSRLSKAVNAVGALEPSSAA